MDLRLDLLLNMVYLLYREQLQDRDDSNELVRNTLKTIDDQRAYQRQTGTEELELAIENLLQDMLEDTHSKEQIQQTLTMLLSDKEKLLNTVADSLSDLTEEENVKRVKQLKTYIYNYYKHHQIRKMLQTGLYDLTNGKGRGKHLDNILEGLSGKIEYLREKSASDNKNIIHVDLGDDEAMDSVVSEVLSGEATGSVFKTGFVGLNTMFQGGFRKGEYVNIGALAHNYKTGLYLSLMTSIPYYNVPVMKDESKKPLIAFFSFEDPVKNNIEFIYRLLYSTENDKKANLDEITPQEMRTYIKTRLTRNGFHVKFYRLNPSDTNYRDIINEVLTLEADGYEVQALGMDYLTMVSTEGCNTSGPTGTDIRDLIRRIRNFCASKDILAISPVQLSPTAKQLLRNGVPEIELVKHVANKGMYSGSSQLDQEFDLSIVIGKAVVNRKAYLTIQREKHRLSTVIDDDDLYVIYPFSKGRPIPFDLERDKPIHMKSLGFDGSDSLF